MDASRETIIVTIIDNKTNEVLKKVCQTSSSLDISNLSAGIYLVRVKSQEETEVKKLVVE